MSGARASRTARRGVPGWRGAAIVVAAAMLALSLAGIAGAVGRSDPSAVAGTGGGAQISRAAGVRIESFAYHPPTLRVARGTIVTFANASSTAHTATRSGSFTTGRIKPGKSVAIRFSQKGTFAYHCTIHPFMHGKIVVE